jgi:hypothetical protein
MRKGNVVVSEWKHFKAQGCGLDLQALASPNSVLNSRILPNQ